ncbi:MAG: cupredoxin domain-containing protein [Actinobacteria bacterium]|nr:cupredoxin domain-containing protein [Actinomycetota bacterium]
MTAAWINWRRRLGLAAVASIALLGFAGLRAAAGESATTATASRAQTERIVNFEYRPTPLRVGAGTTVVFSNQSSVTHTATANGGSFDTGQIRPGRSARVTFRRPGIYLFHCTIHPFMHGKIIVR